MNGGIVLKHHKTWKSQELKLLRCSIFTREYNFSSSFYFYGQVVHKLVQKLNILEIITFIITFITVIGIFLVINRRGSHRAWTSLLQSLIMFLRKENCEWRKSIIFQRRWYFRDTIFPRRSCWVAIDLDITRQVSSCGQHHDTMVIYPLISKPLSTNQVSQLLPFTVKWNLYDIFKYFFR